VGRNVLGTLIRGRAPKYAPLPRLLVRASRWPVATAYEVVILLPFLDLVPHDCQTVLDVMFELGGLVRGLLYGVHLGDDTVWRRSKSGDGVW
jgi:hypothetical protein